MAWTYIDPSNQIPQGIQVTDTVQNAPLGTIAQAHDPIHGFGEFIYLQGVASCVAGSLVSFNWSATAANNFQATLDPATANLSIPKAFAMGAHVAGTYGWFQIRGAAIAANNGTAAVGNAFAKATGQIGSAAVAGTQVLNTQIAVANGSTFTKANCRTQNGSTTVIVPNLDGLFIGVAVSGTGIPGGATVAAGQNGQPFSGNNAIVLSAAATADGSVTLTFTRTNFSVVMTHIPIGQGQIT